VINKGRVKRELLDTVKVMN